MLPTVDARPQTPVMDLEELVRRFHLQQRKVEISQETVRTYRSPLAQFLRWMAEHGVTRTDQLTRALLEDWQESLKDRQMWPARNARTHLQPATRSIYSIAVRQLLAYGVGLELVTPALTQAILRVKVHRGLPRPIPPLDLAKIAAYLERKKERRKLTGVRNQALFWALVTSGSRISEALQVTRDDACRTVGLAPTTAQVTRKGGDQGMLIFPPAVTVMLRAYLEKRTDASPWLWVTHAKGGWQYLASEPPPRLTPKAVNEIWTRLARRAGVQRFTSHQARHTCATQMLAAGLPEMTIANHLGHADLRQMTNYAEVSPEHRQAATAAMNRLVTRHRPAKPTPLAPWPTPAASVAGPPRPAPTPIRLEQPELPEAPWSDVAGAL